jgi:uncharacterized protein (TIGR02246 family)
MYLLPMIFSLLSLFSIATVGAPFATAMPPNSNPNDPSLIEGANAYLKAVMAGDAQAVAMMFDDDAILMPPNQRLLRGRLAIRRFYASWCHSAMKPASFSFDHLDATVSGDFAYDVGTYKMSIPTGPGRKVEDSGKFTVVLKRSGSDWKIAYLICNSDLPPQLPAAARAK